MNLLAQLAARLAEWRRTCVEIGRLVGCARTSLCAFDADLGARPPLPGYLALH
jgi:hypothetical protein